MNYYNTKQNGDGISDFVGKLLDKTQKFAGERHVPLYTKKGFKLARYAGPGTEIIKRLDSKDSNIREPLNPTDKTAQAHDIRYTLAKTPADIRNADLIMINKLKDIEKNKEDYAINISSAKNAMKSKVIFENVSGKKALFGNLDAKSKKENALSVEDEKKLQTKLSSLELQGFGLRQ